MLRRVRVRFVLPTLVAVLLLLAGAPSAFAPPKKPVVVTGAASAITQTTATVAGTVNPKGSATTWHVQYGTTTGYGSVTPPQSAGSGNTAVAVSANLSGLTPATTYHYRISATNVGGTSIGLDATLVTQNPPAPGCTGVPVTPADNVQAKLDAEPAGTTFCFQPGTYRPAGQDGYAPATGQRLIGAGLGVVLSGAKVLAGPWTHAGAQWWAPAFLPAANNGNGFCAVGGDTGLCRHRQDVFRDTIRLVRAATPAEVGPGKFHTDYAQNRVYVGDDPAGHLVEQAWANRIVASTASGITVSNMVVEKAANDAQSGAVEPLGTAGGWTVTYNDVRDNHGGGIGMGDPATGNGSVFAHNQIRRSGQIGISGQGDDQVVEANEIDGNNALGFECGWEAGGSKFAITNRLTVRGNSVHDNACKGLWSDINNYQTLYEGNDVRDNADAGIEHEISYDATITGNTVVRNGLVNGEPGIMVWNSPNVEVAANKVYDSDAGIYLFDQGRYTDGSGVDGYRGPHYIANVSVHDNDVGQTGGGFGQTGLWAGDDPTRHWVFTTCPAGPPTCGNNTFIGNHYHWPDPGATRFLWDAMALDFTAWQAAGNDTTGTMDATPPTIPPPPALVVGPQADPVP